jgi:PAS domain S-box-containing protein
LLNVLICPILPSFFIMLQTNHSQSPFEITLEERLRFHIFSSRANSMSEIAWSAQPDGVADYYNRHWFRYTGMTLKKTKEVGWVKVIHPADLPVVVERWTRSLCTGEYYEAEFRLLRADGIYRWHVGRGAPVRDAGGKIVKWFGTCTDIEDYKREQKGMGDLHEQEMGRLRDLVRELEDISSRADERLHRAAD